MSTAVQPERSTEPCRWPTREEVEEKLREARRAATKARHTGEDLAAEAVSMVRRHPARSVGGAMIGGALTGSLVGFGAAWFMRTRRHWGR